MEKLYNDTALEQLRELEYAIRKGLVLSDEAQREMVILCQDIISLIEERI